MNHLSSDYKITIFALLVYIFLLYVSICHINCLAVPNAYNEFVFKARYSDNKNLN